LHRKEAKATLAKMCFPKQIIFIFDKATVQLVVLMQHSCIRLDLPCPWAGPVMTVVSAMKGQTT
jgi:hypothetical protein